MFSFHFFLKKYLCFLTTNFIIEISGVFLNAFLFMRIVLKRTMQKKVGERVVREDSVKLMSRIAIYEKRKGKTQIPMNGYYKKDYVRIQTLKAMVGATIAFVLTGAIIIIYRLDVLLSNIFKMDYKRIVVLLVIGYLLWLVAYWIIARLFYAKKYDDAREDIMNYNHNLRQLQSKERKKDYEIQGGIVIHDDFIEF